VDNISLTVEVCNLEI